MATAAVSSASCNHLHNQSLPLIDIRLLSQSELLSLSLCSSCSSYSLQNDTDVSTPRIDRSVFNESAGSRKQTFSRLRLAPRATSSASSTRFPPTPFYQNPLPDEDNSQIISLLKSLFGSTSSTIPLEDNNTLVSVPIQYNSYAHLPSTSHSELLNLPISIVDQVNPLINSSLKKRKRGRPRKHENNYNTYYFNGVTDCGPTEVAITESMENKEEGVLGSVEDPYGAELMMRTEGMRTEAELLGFLEGLDGEWMSKRKKKMIVDAGVLADVLPEGWKLMLALKKRADHFWLTCRRYIRF